MILDPNFGKFMILLWEPHSQNKEGSKLVQIGSFIQTGLLKRILRQPFLIPKQNDSFLHVHIKSTVDPK